MDSQQMKKMYGDEYPAAVINGGVRMPLQMETPFTRHYASPDAKRSVHVSRFMDESATMTLTDLQRQWPSWTEWERVDFCQSACWLQKQDDFRDLLRFVMKHGKTPEWSAAAGLIGTYLPQEEAFRFLTAALQEAEVGKGANLGQGVAVTKHPEAEETLRQRLRVIWESPKLWLDDEFLNWEAEETMWCIEHLLELGAPPANFELQVRRLAGHACQGNRESCRRWLSKHYDWLR